MNRATVSLMIEVGPGELVDKITILQIKSERIDDPAKLRNVRHELEVLGRAHAEHLAGRSGLAELEAQLKAVNEELWVIEDDIRDCEREGDFGPRFIDLARSVYRQNDKRATLKKEINLLCGSAIVEEKSYVEFE